MTGLGDSNSVKRRSADVRRVPIANRHFGDRADTRTARLTSHTLAGDNDGDATLCSCHPFAHDCRGRWLGRPARGRGATLRRDPEAVAWPGPCRTTRRAGTRHRFVKGSTALPISLKGGRGRTLATERYALRMRGREAEGGSERERQRDQKAVRFGQSAHAPAGPGPRQAEAPSPEICRGVFHCQRRPKCSGNPMCFAGRAERGEACQAQAKAQAVPACLYTAN